ncbi:hypothetical protein GOBAR_AA09227 [Gossypium barbadense]|uniref:Hydrophobic seed protein domain-containing protein n=1 Tax=Gossypium barbadense TaxID=3634 RepID=A0A2P5Y733_GOSBA|nr:hypothetical protein GOBAR_AA09227 [Gossypium barbadense]
MAWKRLKSLTLFLVLNILFFSPVSARGSCPSPSPKPKPKPTPSPSPCAKGKCPIDALKLGVCANILGLANVTIGTPPVQPCCSLLQAIKANILGINLNVPVSLNLLLNICSRKIPSYFQFP